MENVGMESSMRFVLTILLAHRKMLVDSVTWGGGPDELVGARGPGDSAVRCRPRPDAVCSGQSS